MPIYAYRCHACDFSKDVLQQLSDAPLSVCPSCGKAEFKKQVTAAGFQLTGTGWYATDFKGSAKPSSTQSEETKTENKIEPKTETTPAPTSDSTPTSS